MFRQGFVTGPPVAVKTPMRDNRIEVPVAFAVISPFFEANQAGMGTIGL
jgi:hypothetical protein